MTELHRRLLRDLPERRSPKSGDFNTEARAVRHWVSALPLANFSATARMLADALRAMNRLRVAPAERLEALEILRGTVTQLATLIDKQIVGSSFPLPPQRAEIGILAQEFQSELSLGYRMALHDFCAPHGSVPMLRGKQVALAAQRALAHGGARLQKAYLLYRTPPQGAWRGMHDTFRFVASLGLDNKAVDDVVLGASISSRTAYAHALLLALANPYRYAQREMLEVIALTCTFAPYCELVQATDDGEVVHPVDVESDLGPGYLPEERTAVTDGVLSVKLGALLDYIESQIASLPPGIRLATFRMRGGPPLQVDIDLAQRLVDSWTSDGSRDQVRLPGGHVLDTVVGLHALHFVLAGNDDFDVFLRRVRGSSIQLSEQNTAASWVMGSTEQLRAMPQAARVIDQSLGGYRVIWETGGQGSAVRAKVGELIGLSLPDCGESAPDWMVGVIRWMRIDDEGRVDAGIGLLARRSLAIGVNALDSTGNPMADRRGILLSPMQSEESAVYSSLLTPGLFERESDAIQLTLPADAHRWPSSACVVKVIGAGLMESAGAYLRFALPSMELPDEGLEVA
jgi:hypothetical protein